MSSLRSNLSPKLSGSSASSSRTVKPRDYSHLNQPSTSANDLPAGSSSSSPSRPTTLSSAADELRSHLLDPSTSQQTNDPEIADLPGCLFLLKQLLEEGAHADGPRRRRTRATERGREHTCTVARAVDGLLSSSTGDEEDFEDSSDELARVLVTSWPVKEDNKDALSPLDLLVDPSISRTSLLSHPTLIDAVDQLWTSGSPFASSSGASSPVQAALASLDRLCTPRYLHALAAASKVAHLALVLSLLFRPGSLVPDRQDGRPPGHWVLNWREVLWIIFSVGAVVELGTTRPSAIPISTSFPLVSLLLGVLSTTDSTALAYPVLSISIVPFFLSLISSTTPSLTHLFYNSSLLPLSTYTSFLLSRLAKPSLLFLPLAGALFIALAWSLNGDIWRLGVQLPMEPPGEIGVAPFAVRMWLAIALAVVLAGWVLVGCSRCRGVEEDQEETLISDGIETASDPWAVEWGKGPTRRARVARAKALRRYLVVLPHAPALMADDTSNSESQPLLTPTPSSDRSTLRTRLPLSPIIPVPSPFNLVTLVASTGPALILASLPSPDPARRQGQAARWELTVERWLWRTLALVAGIWVHEGLLLSLRRRGSR